MPKKYGIILGVLLLLSVGAHVWIYMGNFLPVATDNSLFGMTARWDGDRSVVFEGVPISLENKRSNLKDGYQVFAGSIRTTFTRPPQIECQFVRTTVMGQSVFFEKPFEAQDRPCKVLALNWEKQTATMESWSMTFSLRGKNVTWQDAKDQGPLVQVFDRVFDAKKYE